MHTLVTGAAGFIGSTLSERLIDAGHAVTGIDCFHDYYDRRYKEANLTRLLDEQAFTFREENLLATDPAFLRTFEVIYHLAGQPGVRASWGASFSEYITNNIAVTQRLLEILKDAPTLKKLVFASSSSVYGNAQAYPLSETARPEPVSPYGVTKLTAEHLCLLYHTNFGIPTTCLRYFTVYGPRQRPDMAFHRFFRAILTGSAITVYGDGTQTRDFSYIDDIAGATMAAGLTFTDESCCVMNIGGGRRVPLNRVFELIADITGIQPKLTYQPTEKGDMRDTLADISRARTLIGYEPTADLADGLAREFAWMQEHRDLLFG